MGNCLVPLGVKVYGRAIMYRCCYGRHFANCIRGSEGRQIWRKQSNDAGEKTPKLSEQTGCMCKTTSQPTPLLRYHTTPRCSHYKPSLRHHENARPHKTRVTAACLRNNEYVQLFPWPSKLTDLNQTEHMERNGSHLTCALQASVRTFPKVWSVLALRPRVKEVSGNT